MQYRIDYIRENELRPTLELVKKVFYEFNKKDYDKNGLKSFLSFINEKNIAKQLRNGKMIILVARTNYNEVIGTVGVSCENHITFIYVNPRYHRKSIGTNLLRLAINVCKYNDEYLEKVTVNSSTESIEFFEEYGFEKLAKLQECDGIRFMPMKMSFEVEERFMDDELLNDEIENEEKERLEENEEIDPRILEQDEEDDLFSDSIGEDDEVIPVEDDGIIDFFSDKSLESCFVKEPEEIEMEYEKIMEKDESITAEDQVYEILNEFYSEACDEENRLRNSKVGTLEFITTTTYVDKYLCKNDRILEIGAGTGIYSNFYASKGYKVDAVELLDVNYQKLKQYEGKNLKAHKANATDLSEFQDNTFDITLVLGPMYHLFSDEEQNKAIEEAIRVTKPCGKIFFAYITNETVMINHFLRENHLVDKKELHDDKFIVKNDPKAVFYVCTVDEFKNKMKYYDIKFLKNVATDGISSIVKSDVEYLDNEEFEEWIKYHLATCEREDLMGFSTHVLYICEKNMVEDENTPIELDFKFEEESN